MAKRILIADDDAGIIRFYSIVMTKLGYEVLIAKDGNETIEIAERELPDLLFTDTEMPELKGYEICKQLKQNPQTQHIKVIGASGKRDAYKQAYEEANADAYVNKPCSLNDLESLMKRLLQD